MDPKKEKGKNQLASPGSFFACDWCLEYDTKGDWLGPRWKFQSKYSSKREESFRQAEALEALLCAARPSRAFDLAAIASDRNYRT